VNIGSNLEELSIELFLSKLRPYSTPTVAEGFGLPLPRLAPPLFMVDS